MNYPQYPLLLLSGALLLKRLYDHISIEYHTGICFSKWGGRMVLGKLPVLQFGYSRARAYCACSRCGWGLLDIFTLLYLFSSLSPSLRETARYRLKYCLKGPLNPNQPTNQQLFKTYKCIFIHRQQHSLKCWILTQQKHQRKKLLPPWAFSTQWKLYYL